MNEIFPSIYRVFVILGIIVGVVVITYMMYNAYKYREGADHDLEVDRPQVGELPEDEGGGRKLAVSLTLSAIIVIGLIGWTYVALRNVEGGVPDAAEKINIRVEGYRFGWQFTYPNGYTSTMLRVPEGRPIALTVTSRDVIHNFGIPAFNIKADAIPHQTTDTWFIGRKTGNYTIQCFELCGPGHSMMESKVVVMEPEEYDKWYAGTSSENGMSSPKNTSSAMGSLKNTSSAMGSSNSYSIDNTSRLKHNDGRPA